MNCEICGQTIPYKPYKVIVEGAKLLVCESCAQLKTASWEEEEKIRSRQATGFAKPRGAAAAPPSRKSSTLDDEFMLVPDYGTQVRRARERRNWSQEELGLKINEKASFIAKVEAGKVAPPLEVVRKLEHTLGVSLMTKEMPQPSSLPKHIEPHEMTIGDVVKIEKRGVKGEPAEGSFS